MVMNKKVIVSKDQPINTYSELWHGSRILLEKSKIDLKGSNWTTMASLIFTAFSMEAYLNHVGERIFKSWKALEYLTPLKKLDVICEKFNIDLDHSRRPYQTVKELFDFRNEMAHGRTTKLSTEEIKLLDDDIDKYLGESLKAWWQKYCTINNANRAREDSEKIMQLIHDIANIENDHLFSFGISSHSAKITS
jgi:hypothetical protein